MTAPSYPRPPDPAPATDRTLLELERLRLELEQTPTLLHQLQQALSQAGDIRIEVGEVLQSLLDAPTSKPTALAAPLVQSCRC